MTSYTDIRPFSIAVPDNQLHELQAKLDLTRLPDELDLPAGCEWEWGIPVAVLKPIVEYWRMKYDWRAVERHINETLPQFTTCVESLAHEMQEVHFVHKRSNNPEAIPLIFVSKLIDELTNPKDPKHPSFHVVAPSLPGFVFSQRAGTPGVGARASAYIFDKLMAKLGYKHYIAQGGDWGYYVCRAFVLYHQIFKTMLGFAGLPGGYSKAEIEDLKTLAYALTDSPVGLLAWISEKLYAWTDNYPWTPEEVITWTMLYWIRGPAGGLRYYKENSLFDPPRDPELFRAYDDLHNKWSPTLHGFSSFPKEISRAPLEWGGANHNMVYTNKHNKGGHFAAWEVAYKTSPELLLADIQDFARVVLEKEPQLVDVV